jgi:hypothetical protein
MLRPRASCSKPSSWLSWPIWNLIQHNKMQPKASYPCPSLGWPWPPASTGSSNLVEHVPFDEGCLFGSHDGRMKEASVGVQESTSSQHHFCDFGKIIRQHLDSEHRIPSIANRPSVPQKTRYIKPIMQFTALLAFAAAAFPLVLASPGSPIVPKDLDNEVYARNVESHKRSLDELFKRVGHSRSLPYSSRKQPC